MSISKRWVNAHERVAMRLLLTMEGVDMPSTKLTAADYRLLVVDMAICIAMFAALRPIMHLVF